MVTESERTVVYGHDMFVTDQMVRGKQEEQLFEMLESDYGTRFSGRLEHPTVVSTNSRKAIVTDLNTGQKFFLKEKPPYCVNESSLVTTADFQHYLSQVLPFVPQIRTTTSGGHYCRIGNSVFVLTEFRPGRLFRADRTDISAAAQALGQLHTAAQHFPFMESYLTESSLAEAMDFTDWADELPAAINDPWREEAIAFLRAVLLVNQENDLTPRIPIMMNHGDFSPFNVEFGDKTLAAVNDFDNAAYAPRVRDVSAAVIAFCDGISYAGATTNFRRPISQMFSIDKAQWFLDEYLNNAPGFDVNEIAQLYLEMRTRWVQLMDIGILRGDFAYIDVLQGKDFLVFLEASFSKLFK